MKPYRWPIHLCAALALFLGAGVEARGQEQVAGAEPAQEKQPAEANALVLPARVRLRMADGSRLTGELLRVEEGRFTVRTMARIPEERFIALTEVKSAEVSRGSHGHARGGFLMGGAIGLIAVSVLALQCEDPCSGKGIAIAEGSLLIGGLGAGIGALIRTPRWSDVPVSSLSAASTPVKADNEPAEASPDRQVRFAIAPTLDRGVKARFSISWR